MEMEWKWKQVDVIGSWYRNKTHPRTVLYLRSHFHFTSMNSAFSVTLLACLIPLVLQLLDHLLTPEFSILNEGIVLITGFSFAMFAKKQPDFYKD